MSYTLTLQPHFTRDNPMRKMVAACFIAHLSLLYGCASVVTGQNQLISVLTPNCPGAVCTLVNDDGTYHVTTPGTVSVNREYDPMTISCEKEEIEPLLISVESKTQSAAFGNIILGGIIGAGVDMATGAAYDYPSEIINPLDCRSEAEIALAVTSGSYDAQALAMVDPEVCNAPVFAMKNGNEEIYKSECDDGTIGVIGCLADTCRPLNVSRPAEKDENKPKRKSNRPGS